MLKQIWIIFFLLTTNYFLLTTYSHALELRSPRFKLELEKADIDVIKDKSVVYTIKSLHGAQAFERFKSKGYVITNQDTDKSMTFSLSQSVINFTGLTPDQSQKGEITLSGSIPNEQDFSVSLIQEYLLKNLSGETIDLVYSLDNIYFRPLPNQNNGDFPSLIMAKKVKSPDGKTKIFFKLNPRPNQPEGTYETIVDFVAIPN